MATCTASARRRHTTPSSRGRSSTWAAPPSPPGAAQQTPGDGGLRARGCGTVFPGWVPLLPFLPTRVRLCCPRIQPATSQPLVTTCCLRPAPAPLQVGLGGRVRDHRVTQTPRRPRPGAAPALQAGGQPAAGGRDGRGEGAAHARGGQGGRRGRRGCKTPGHPGARPLQGLPHADGWAAAQLPESHCPEGGGARVRVRQIRATLFGCCSVPGATCRLPACRGLSAIHHLLCSHSQQVWASAR
jgi:hypothetical protein